MSFSNHIRLLIAEGDITLLEALAIFFDLQDDIEVVGQSDDPAQTHALCQQLKPDVVLMDPELQQMNEILFIRTLCQENPDTKIVVLAAPFDGVTSAQVLQAGAAKYLAKGIFATELVETIRDVYHQ